MIKPTIMKQKDIEILIEKYLNGETTPEEEKALAAEVSRDDTPQEWKIIAEMLGELTIDEALYDKMMAERNTKPRVIKFWPWLAAACVAALLIVFLAPPRENTTTVTPQIAKIEPKVKSDQNDNNFTETKETKHLAAQKKHNTTSYKKASDSVLSESEQSQVTEQTETLEEIAFEDRLVAEVHDDLQEQMQMCDIVCFNNKLSRRGQILMASLQENKQ